MQDYLRTMVTLSQQLARAFAMSLELPEAFFDEMFRYPDGGADLLRAAIGKRWGLPAERIVCGAGSDDLLYQFCLAYGGPGREIVEPTSAVAFPAPR